MWSHAWWTSWQLTLNRIIVRKEIVLKSYFSVLGYYTLICLSTLNINVSWMYRAVILLNLHNDNKAAGMFNMLFIYSFINSSINLLWSCYCYEFMSYLPYYMGVRKQEQLTLHGHLCSPPQAPVAGFWWFLTLHGHLCSPHVTVYLVVSNPSWTSVFTTCNCLFGSFLPFMATCVHHM